MSGGGGGMMAALGNQAPAQGGVGYSAPAPSTPYQPAFNSQQAPMQTGPTTGGPGIGLGGQMNHMVQPDSMPQQSSTVGIGPVSQFGDKPPITANPQQMQQRPMSPLMQQQMMRQQQMFNPMQQSSGLQAALMQMLSMRNQPMMRPQMQQMSQYRSPALGFRPNMAQAQQSLNRVQPSVFKTDLDAARARVAELEAGMGGG